MRFQLALELSLSLSLCERPCHQEVSQDPAGIVPYRRELIPELINQLLDQWIQTSPAAQRNDRGSIPSPMSSHSSPRESLCSLSLFLLDPSKITPPFRFDSNGMYSALLLSRRPAQTRADLRPWHPRHAPHSTLHAGFTPCCHANVIDDGRDGDEVTQPTRSRETITC